MTAQRVTIVMYHFVRNAGATAFPRLPATDLDRFRGQLEYLGRHYSPVRLSDVANAVHGKCVLPPSPVVLTFDDGYRDHFDAVFPALAERGWPGTFFVSRSALLDRVLLDVNKVQFVLAAGEAAAIAREVDEAVASAGDDPVRYRARWAAASRFDRAEVVYVKRALQHALPDAIRRPLLDGLCRRFVTADANAFADDLYMTLDQARQMRAAGMEFGGHGDRHLPLPALDPAGQTAEIDGALGALQAIGAPTRDFVYSYVKGEHDAKSMRLLRDRGCTAAVTTRPDIARATADEMLALPRLDTNDLPSRRDAPPGDWTRRAAAAASERAS